MLKKLFSSKVIKTAKKIPLSILSNYAINMVIEKITADEKDVKAKMKKEANYRLITAIGTLFIPQNDYVSQEFLVINSFSNVINNYMRTSENTETINNSKYMNAENDEYLNAEDFDNIEAEENYIEEEEEINGETEIIEEEEEY